MTEWIATQYQAEETETIAQLRSFGITWCYVCPSGACLPVRHCELCLSVLLGTHPSVITMIDSIYDTYNYDGLKVKTKWLLEGHPATG